MFSASCAEWILARLTNETRAASIVGDLLEDARERGPEWFWLCVAGIVLSLTWRYFLALMVGLVSCQILRSLPVPVFGQLHGLPAVPQPPHSWWPFFHWLGYICMLLWVAAPYTAIRYGLRDRFAQLTVFICLTLSTPFLCWRIPAVLAGNGPSDQALGATRGQLRKNAGICRHRRSCACGYHEIAYGSKHAT